MIIVLNAMNHRYETTKTGYKCFLQIVAMQFVVLLDQFLRGMITSAHSFEMFFICYISEVSYL